MLAKAKWQVGTINVLEKVFEERLRQHAQYGFNDDLRDYPDDGNHWLAGTSHALPALDAKQLEEVFRDEYEAAKAGSPDSLPTWMHLVREEFAEAMAEDPDSDEFIAEILQVAALCVSWVETKQRQRAARAAAMSELL